jgi:predicted AlkP superfamily phosphohydrolase/phosphomutase
VAGRVIAEEEPDVALVYLGGLDTAVHRFLAPAMPEFFEGPGAVDDACADVIPNYYRFVDQSVERLTRLTDSRTIFILCSAYGAHPSDAAPPATGGHEMGPPGVMIARGPHMPRHGRTLAPSTMDLAPTILAVLGLPVSGRMTGSVLIDMIPEDVLGEHPLTLEEPSQGPPESAPVPHASERMERLVSERMGRLAGAH